MAGVRICCVFFLMLRRPPRPTQSRSSAASDVYNRQMQDGNLILRGIASHTQKNDTAPYLTGGVYTKGKKLFTGGRVEVCARLQAAKGAWPAIWMLPEKAEWPKGGEIDIMERLNHDRIAYQTTHSYYTHILGIKDNPPHGGINKINPEEYNIYSVDIYPDSLVFAVNHRHTYTYCLLYTSPSPRD